LGVKCFAIQADAGQESDFVKMQEIARREFGQINILVANAVLLASDGGNFYCGQILSPNGGAVFF
jgi:NAD(P)-dependent dehydrogenase (short-subunit alcohol dehydrogenase family)